MCRLSLWSWNIFDHETLFLRVIFGDTSIKMLICLRLVHGVTYIKCVGYVKQQILLCLTIPDTFLCSSVLSPLANLDKDVWACACGGGGVGRGVSHLDESCAVCVWTAQWRMDREKKAVVRSLRSHSAPNKTTVKEHISLYLTLFHEITRAHKHKTWCCSALCLIRFFCMFRRERMNPVWYHSNGLKLLAFVHNQQGAWTCRYRATFQRELHCGGIERIRRLEESFNNKKKKARGCIKESKIACSKFRYLEVLAAL